MSAVSLSLFKESEVVYIFSTNVMKYKMFSEEKLSQAGQKNNKALTQNLFTQTHRTVWNMKKLHQYIIY